MQKGYGAANKVMMLGIDGMDHCIPKNYWQKENCRTLKNS